MSYDVKHRQLVGHQAFRLDRELAEVEMPGVTSRFTYNSKRRTDIIDRLKGG